VKLDGLPPSQSNRPPRRAKVYDIDLRLRRAYPRPRNRWIAWETRVRAAEIDTDLRLGRLDD
jgi:hypothetical protein